MVGERWVSVLNFSQDGGRPVCRACSHASSTDYIERYFAFALQLAFMVAEPRDEMCSQVLANFRLRFGKRAHWMAGTPEAECNTDSK